MTLVINNDCTYKTQQFTRYNYFDNWHKNFPASLLDQNIFVLLQKLINSLLSTINLRVNTTFVEVSTIDKEKVILTTF